MSLARLRAWWVSTSHRAIITRLASPTVASLQGTVLDVGGGRAALHDRSWPPQTRRVRVDLVATYQPDIVADAMRLPIRSGSIDAVVAFETLEHLPDPGAVANEIHRVLRPGGAFHGTAPFIYPVHGDPHDYLRFTADGLREVLQAFEVVDVRPYGNHWSAAWLLLTTQSRTWRLLSPLLRRWRWRTNPRCPEGYAFTAEVHDSGSAGTNPSGSMPGGGRHPGGRHD